MAVTHEYISTACLHGQHGSCRKTCKFCDASCRCRQCHWDVSADAVPEPWVDQARKMASDLLAILPPAYIPEHLRQRIAEEPALFWLRGEVQPDGVWTPP